MASTYSDLKFELIGTGEQSGTWGTTTNTNLGTAIEEAITGSADVTFASATVTLTLTDTNASQTARNLRLNLTGTSGGAQDLVVPAIEKFYIVNNGCSDTITVKVSGQTGVGVPAGKAMLLFNNGTDVVNAVNHFDSLTLTTALAVAQGGTGATTASGARTNLGAGTVGGNVFTAATAAAAQQAMDTEVGVDVQAYDADLTAIGGLANTDGNFIVGNGSTWVAESGATARTSLGLGALATLSTVDAATITDNSVGADELNVSGDGTSGQYLASDGDGTMTWTNLPAGGFSNVQVFTATGTWTNPGNVDKVKVTVVGGGGGGGGGGPSTSVGGGGGGGAGSAVEVVPFPTATNVAVTVGPGSTGGSVGPNNGGNGNSGGTSSFGAYCSATGGGGGLGAQGYGPATSGLGGTYGTGSGGTYNTSGGYGDNGRGLYSPNNMTMGGNGGASVFGGGGRGGQFDNIPSQAASPTAYGAGGGGGGGRPGTVGSGGTQGIVIVEY